MKRNIHVINIGTKYIETGTNIISKIILVPILIKVMGQTSYGVWVTAFSLLAYLSLFSFGGDSGLVQRISLYLGEGNNRKIKEAVVSMFYFFLTIASILIIIVLFSGNSIISFLFSKNRDLIGDFTPVFVILFANYLLSFLNIIFNQIIVAYKKQYISNGFRCLQNIMLVGFILFCYFRNLSITYIALSYLVSRLITMIFLFIPAYRFVRVIPFNIKYFSVERLKDVLPISFYFFLIQIAVMVVYNTDNIIIAKFLGASFVTAYAIAFKVGIYFKIIYFNIITNFVPFLATEYGKGNKEYLIKMWTALNNTIIYFFLPAGLFLLLQGQFIISKWVGPENFIGNKIYYTAMAFIFMQIIISPNGMLLGSIGKNKKQSYCSIIEAAFNLILSIILVNVMGLFGVILATVIAELFTSFWYNYYLLRKIIKISYIKFFSERKRLIYVIFIIIAFAIGRLIVTYNMNSSMNFVICFGLLSIFPIILLSKEKFNLKNVVVKVA
jgi:O-antigen/teichoic acid export membrane protein